MAPFSLGWRVAGIAFGNFRGRRRRLEQNQGKAFFAAKLASGFRSRWRRAANLDDNERSQLEGGEMVRYIFLIVGFVLLTAAEASSQSLSVSGQQEPANTGRQKPAVNIQEQPGSPMRISSLQTKWATPAEQGLEIYAVVENVSGVDIRAYALRNRAMDGIESVGDCLLHNVNSRGKILRPGDTDGKSTWRGIPLDVPAFNIDLSLDFVEFANGTSWGVDACQSTEKLSGLRAGAVAARERLARMMDQNNGRALVNLLKLTPPMLDAPDGHSPLWVKSFHGGVRGLFERVKNAHHEGGLPEVERVLRLPIDASENR
jgi:hypothetical protein